MITLGRPGPRARPISQSCARQQAGSECPADPSEQQLGDLPTYVLNIRHHPEPRPCHPPPRSDIERATTEHPIHQAAFVDTSLIRFSEILADLVQEPLRVMSRRLVMVYVVVPKRRNGRSTSQMARPHRARRWRLATAGPRAESTRLRRRPRQRSERKPTQAKSLPLRGLVLMTTCSSAPEQFRRKSHALNADTHP